MASMKSAHSPSKGRPSLSVYLLGAPEVRRDGAEAGPPRGRKVWALLAFLALTERPPSRQELVDLLFADADDPFGALRWNLSELRRLLGDPDTVQGRDTVVLSLPEDSFLDVRALLTGPSGEAVEIPSLGRELLEGIDIASSTGFQGWLLAQRRYLQASAGAVLREGALRRLAAGDPWGAVGLATRLLALETFDEDAHELLLRAFSATGDRDAVARQLAASEALFRGELGVAPGPAVYRAAAEVSESRVAASASQGPGVWLALLDSGEAAVGAGAIEVGLQNLRRAAVGGGEAGDLALKTRALLALGSALIHAAKGRDEEGSAALHEAIVTAEAAERMSLAASAHRELGYVELLRGEYPSAHAWLHSAEALAGDDVLELARIRAVSGLCLSDVGRHGAAEENLQVAVRLAEQAGHAKQVAWSLAFLGRSLLLRGELDSAEESLARSLELATAHRWTAFISCPEALLGEVWVRRGDLDRVGGVFDHAFALGCEVDDACWEAYAVRGLGLLRAARGDLDGAVTLMEEATTRCLRQRDTYLWIRAYTLDALCATAVAGGHPDAGKWIEDLESLAGRTGMREMAARAYLHRRDLGDPAAVGVARALAIEIDNDRLTAALTPDGPPLLDELLGRTEAHDMAPTSASGGPPSLSAPA
jgi:DNA-binding SARP family transcriptional activator